MYFENGEFLNKITTLMKVGVSKLELCYNLSILTLEDIGGMWKKFKEKWWVCWRPT